MAAIALFMMTSCSDDDSNSTNEQTASKLTKVTVTDIDGSFTSTLSYNGNKLATIIDSDGTKNTITYTGDLVTQWVATDSSNELLWKDIYQYNSQNQLVNFYELDYEEFLHTKTTYVHNADGTISYTEYASGSDDLNSFTEKSIEGILTATTMSIVHEDDFTEQYTYAFDGKNSPFKGITGFDKIGFAGTDGSTKYYIENVTSQSWAHSGATPVVENTTTYTYNAANYPTKEVVTNVANPTQISTTEYLYE